VVIADVCMDGTGGSIPPWSILMICIVGSIPTGVVLSDTYHRFDSYEVSFSPSTIGTSRMVYGDR